ncbi:hypothetical protein [Crenobacter luteus]|uniref:Uncharacterized protein n=1 Tax=Crenobacter luteus TaxID=1452487 RepID=A0A165F2J1_9NEIS|nr:hypothetical protein [Crenobacter luteus]KZE30259.1 hypothetical protein AVW16_12750 [Crenobacter luteus]
MRAWWIFCAALAGAAPAAFAAADSLVGDYVLDAPGASGARLTLKPDARFEFVRGDIVGDLGLRGGWRREGDEVVLDAGRPASFEPFSLRSQSRAPGERLEVRVDFPDGRPAPGIRVRLETETGPVEGATDENGTLLVPLQAVVHEIVLVHYQFPERHFPTLVGRFAGRAGKNRYHFRLNPEPFSHAVFGGRRLRVDDDRLIWPHEGGDHSIYQRAPEAGAKTPS